MNDQYYYISTGRKSVRRTLRTFYTDAGRNGERIPRDYFIAVLPMDLELAMKKAKEFTNSEIRVIEDPQSKQAEKQEKPKPNGKIWFGKHAGTPFAEIPLEYMKWVFDNTCKFDDPFVIDMIENMGETWKNWVQQKQDFENNQIRTAEIAKQSIADAVKLVENNPQISINLVFSYVAHIPSRFGTMTKLGFSVLKDINGGAKFCIFSNAKKWDFLEVGKTYNVTGLFKNRSDYDGAFVLDTRSANAVEV